MSGMITGSRTYAVLKVVNDVAKQQFVACLKSDAVITYEKNGKHITFITTEVPKEYQGKGIGKILAQHAFTYALEKKLEVTCQCHFLAKYYQDNKDMYKDLKVNLQLE